MIGFLAFVVILLILATLVCIVIAVITPKVFSPIFKKDLGRGKTTLVFLGLLIGLFYLLGVIGNITGTQGQQKNSPTVEPTIMQTEEKPKTKQKETDIKKPEPTIDCSQSAYPQACIQAQINAEPPLNGTFAFTDAGLSVTNNDNVDWTSCDVTIGAEVNIETSFEVAGGNNSFPAHQTTVIPWGEFTQDNGNRFNFAATEPQDVDIDCSVNKQQEHKKIN